MPVTLRTVLAVATAGLSVVLVDNTVAAPAPLRASSSPASSATSADGPSGAATAETLRRFLKETREREGAGPLRFDPALRRAAEAQARAIAARPPNRRLAEPVSLAERLAAEGIVDYAAADRHVDLKKGYPSLASAHGATWREQAASWAAAVDPKTDAVELAVVNTDDGWSVLAVFVVDYGNGDRRPEIVERNIHDRVNRIRTARGLAPLAWHEGLAAVARAHSEEMARTDRFEHRSPRTGRPSDRVTAAGIEWVRVAENLWLGKTVEDPAEGAVDGWMTSPGHRRNLLDADVRQTGVGVVLGADGRWFATQLYLRAPR